MSALVDLVTLLIDLIFDSAAAKLYKRNPAIAWGIAIVGLVVSILTIIAFYRYFG